MNPRLNKQEKIERLKLLIPRSDAVQMNTKMPKEKWAGILADLEEDKVDELLLILDEEAGMLADVEEERRRKHEVNKTSYLQRLEKIRVSVEIPNEKSQ